MKDFLEEIADFFEDFIEVFTDKEVHRHNARKINIKGHIEFVKPAYVFAERLDHFFKIVFGVSIFISAFTTTFVGFVKLSDLLDFLIKSTPGRGIMLVIGLSYLLLGTWKLINLDSKKTETRNKSD